MRAHAPRGLLQRESAVEGGEADGLEEEGDELGGELADGLLLAALELLAADDMTRAVVQPTTERIAVTVTPSLITQP